MGRLCVHESSRSLVRHGRKTMWFRSSDATSRHGNKRPTRTQRPVNCTPMSTKPTAGESFNGTQRGKIRNRGFEAASFKAIMSLFPHCYRMAKHDLQQDWSTLTENFVEALKPCQRSTLAILRCGPTKFLVAIGKQTQ